jgi:hypothetical protein
MAKAPKSPDMPDKDSAPLADEVRDAIEDAVVLDEPLDDPASVQAEQDTTEPVSVAQEIPHRPETITPVAPVKRRGGLGVALGLVVGGLVAAVIGFTAARTIVPEGWPFPGVAPEEDPLVAVVETQDVRIAGLEALAETLATEVEALKADDSLLTLNAELGDRITQETAAIETRLDELAGRITEIEKTAPGGGTEAAEAAAAAYERELAQIRAMVEAELAELRAVQEKAEALEQDAAETAQAAAGRAALSQVMAALDTGQPFAAALDELAAINGVAAPEALAELASEGAPTLAMLQREFPAAARAALDASLRAAVEDGSMNRFAAFLRTQLGTRSLEPKAGDDPDAILSRAEDALRKGQIATALAELDAMPDAAQPALAQWRAMAQTRLAALEAAADLAVALK